MRLRLLIPFLTIAVVSCNDEKLVEVPAGLLAVPSHISFGEAVVGQRVVRRVRVEASGGATRTHIEVLDVPEGFFVSPRQFSLGPDDSAVVEVGFVPSESGLWAGTIRFHALAADVSAELRVEGTGVRTRVQVEPELDFGDVEVGQERTLALDVRNESDFAIQVTLPSPGDRSFAAEPGSFELGPYESKPLRVTFTPWVRAPMRRGLVLEACPACQRVEVDLRGNGILRALEARPRALVFDAVHLGYTRTHTVTLFNSGDVEVELGAVSAIGETFRVDADGLPQRLAAGEQADIGVSYSPHTQGMNQGHVQVFDPQGARLLEIPLTGWTGGPLLVVSPASLDFGFLVTGWDPFPAETIQVRNVGDPADVELLSAAVEGPDADSFQIHFAGPSPIDPLAEVQVDFRPTRDDSHTATLKLLTSAPDQAELAVPLFGVSQRLGSCILRIPMSQSEPVELRQANRIDIFHAGGPPCVLSNFRFEGRDRDSYNIEWVTQAWNCRASTCRGEGDECPCLFHPPGADFLLKPHRQEESVGLSQRLDFREVLSVIAKTVEANRYALRATLRFEVNGVETQSINVMTPPCNDCPW